MSAARSSILANPAVEKFKSCRWKATPEQGDFCTHRDVLPFAGKEGFKPDELNERGKWLLSEKDKLKASEVKAEWLKTYPGGK